MPENKTFQVALIFSFLFHSALFASLPKAPFSAHKLPLKNPEITYYKIEAKPKEARETEAKKEPIQKQLPKISKEEILPKSKAGSKPDELTAEHKPRAIKIDRYVKATDKKFEAVIEEEKDDARKATYISYYRSVRERIRTWVDKNYPTKGRVGIGEVFLSFVVTSRGELIEVRVVDNRSVDNPLLRQIAVDSVRDACPFPAFPPGMDQYRITFNVVISFER